MKFALHNEKALPDAFARRSFLRHIRFHDMTALRAIAAVLPRLHGALPKDDQGMPPFERLAVMARGQRRGRSDFTSLPQLGLETDTRMRRYGAHEQVNDWI